MNLCESHVNTRLRYVQKSVETTGSPSGMKISQLLTIQYSQKESVISVVTDLNAPNGVSKMSDSESGVGLQPLTEERFANSAT